MNDPRISIALRAVLASLAPQALASEAPAKPPARIVVPFTPGGSSDLVGRLIADRLREGQNQRFVVDNRPGAGGVVGTELVAKSAPDGQVLILAYTGTFSINPHLYKSLPYDPVADFTPITPVTTTVYLLVVHPSVPAKSVKELVALATARPGDLNYGSSGNGSVPHLGGAMFSAMAKVKLTHVPYRGASPAMIDLVSGQLHVYFGSGPPVLPHVKTGRLKMLASTSAERSKLYPDVPTIAESGIKGYAMTSWYGLALPAKAPKAMVDALHRAATDAVKRSDFVDPLAAQGLETLYMSSAEFAALIKEEMAFYGKIVRAADIRLD